jgi:CheY-like chemotaxis protein
MMTEPTLLVVDPNPATVRRVEEAFHDVALRVRSARDPLEVEGALDGADLAVVLASASLPRGNGYDLARDLRERFPAAAILLMTGGFEVYNRTRAEECGASGHLSKPFGAEAVRAAIEALTGPLEEAAGGPTPLDVSAAPLLDDAFASPFGASSSAPPNNARTAEPDPFAPPATGQFAASAVPAGAVPDHPPLASDARVATILPRTYTEVPLVAVDPEIVGPAMERAVMEVLPEVVEALLRNALATSPAFRDLVTVAVEEAVRSQLPAIASRVVEARIEALEAQATNAD